MRRRSPPPLSVRAVYRIRELAEAADMDVYSMRRLLIRHEVQFLRSGTACLVPISELKEKLRVLWDSLVEVETLRAATSKRSA